MLRVFKIRIVSIAISGAGVVALEVSIEDPHAWCENVGWLNWTPDATGSDGAVLIHDTFLAGFVWAENVGWINLGDGEPANGVDYGNASGADFGVNIDPANADLFGLAWGENVGWINFDTRSKGDQRARIDFANRRLSGYAWMASSGWVNLDDATHFIGVAGCVAGDVECDGDVDLFDWQSLSLLLTGPGADGAVAAFDADGDGDLDLEDAAALQRNYTGPVS